VWPVGAVELTANLMSVDVDAASWAREREAEGWDGLSVADHLFSDRRPFPHLWVTLTAVATATTRPYVTSAFANNLFRSPVEFAQASLALQAVSGGRFEAGLGAGWSAPEMTRTGREFPGGPERAGRYVEALQVVRSLLHEGSCRFDGRWYQVDVDVIGPMVPPPPLVGACGGPRTIREATPLLDRVELKAASSATRGGQLDLAALGSITRADLEDLVRRVRDVRPDIPLGMFVLCSAGDDERTRAVAAAMPPGSLYGGFFGEPKKVADSIAALAELGITRAQVSPFGEASFPAIADAYREHRP